MNAAEFYEYFKDALDFVGPGFSGMEKVIVCMRGEKIVLTHGDFEATIRLPEEKSL